MTRRLHLHHVHQARSMRSLWLLNELGLDFDLTVHPFGRELRAPGYLARHPLGRVPCLEDGELVLMESGAICEYLCETRDHGGLWRQPGHPERPEWLQWLHFSETMACHVANLTQQHIVIRADTDRSPLIMKLEKLRLEMALNVLEPVLTNREYLLKSGFSAVDTAVGYSVYVARFFTRFEQFPAISEYAARFSARPAFSAALPDPELDAVIYTRDFYPLEPWLDRGSPART